MVRLYWITFAGVYFITSGIGYADEHAANRFFSFKLKDSIDNPVRFNKLKTVVVSATDFIVRSATEPIYLDWMEVNERPWFKSVVQRYPIRFVEPAPEHLFTMLFRGSSGKDVILERKPYPGFGNNVTPESLEREKRIEPYRDRMSREFKK